MKAAERRLRPAEAAASKAAKIWKDENRDAVKAANDYVERYGLPLQRYRQL